MWKRFNKFLLEWKPIHLCWWFIKHGYPIPKYFIGAASAPTVTDSAATNVTPNAATGNGNVTSDGGASVTARGFVYSVTTVNADPLIGGAGVTTTVVSGTTGVFTGQMIPLNRNVGYSYKAYATNSKGTGYGTVQTFTTLASKGLFALA